MNRNRGAVEGAGLFLETSAHIARLLGSLEMARGVLELCRRFPSVGTSQFVLDEFVAVIGGLYSAASGAIRSVTSQSRSRTFSELWSEAVHLLPAYFPGGGKLLSQIVAGLGGRYGEREIAPVEVANFLDGQRRLLLEIVSLGMDPCQPMEIFDSSSCCVWSAGPTECAVEPAEHCRLKALCLDRRNAFLAAISTLARSSREESAWLKRNYKAIKESGNMDLLRLVAEHPGQFGDVVIFLEVPEAWALLTRDRTFRILGKLHRSDMIIYHLRLPRIPSGQKCSVRSASDAAVWMECTLVNWTALDACILSPRRLGGRGSEIVVLAPEFENSRHGKITRVEKLPDGYIQGIRFGQARP